ncbi:reverse transcriptase domain-containing protein [Kosakonia sp. S42]|uniref:reverse transcriptase domain-containing protein n=1 Tax=Kosakonia sp. S42 TaxID=2767458 RepID=UPI00190E00C5|nr:reverse transcriptase domain-containing protein [Kosakonia sp. S42]
MAESGDHLPGRVSSFTKKGTPQGGDVSPLLANLFLHYAQDKWLEKHYPNNSWERYADDSIIHCRSKREAGMLLSQLRERMKGCGLELHPERTRIVNCHPLTRRKSDGHYSFDFLGFTFRRCAARKIAGGLFTGFLPAISNKAQKAIVRTFRAWNISDWQACRQKKSRKGLTCSCVDGSIIMKIFIQVELTGYGGYWTGG